MNHQPVCKFHQRGYCKYGSTCKFLHVANVLKIPRKLVVLDLNGVLVNRSYNPNHKGNSDQEDPNQKGSNCGRQFCVGAFYVTPRPNLIPFIDYLFRHYDVAIWSSATHANVCNTLECVLGKKRCTRFVFIWSQNQCVAVKDTQLSDSDDNQKHKLLLSKPFHLISNRFPQYTSDQILMIDDSIQKYGAQSYPNLFAVSPWDSSAQDDYSLKSTGQIGKFLSGLCRFDGTVPQWISGQ